jgi:hypothetical protein
LTPIGILSRSQLADSWARSLVVESALVTSSNPAAILAELGNDVTGASHTYKNVRDDLANLVRRSDPADLVSAQTFSDIVAAFRKSNPTDVATVIKFTMSLEAALDLEVNDPPDGLKKYIDPFFQFLGEVWSSEEGGSLTIPNVNADTALKICAAVGSFALLGLETFVQYKRFEGFTEEFWDWVEETAVSAAIAVPIGAIPVFAATFTPYGPAVLISLGALGTYLAVRDIAQGVLEVYADQRDSVAYQGAEMVLSLMSEFEDGLAPLVAFAETVFAKLVDGYTAIAEQVLPELQVVSGDGAGFVFEEGQWLIGDDNATLVGSTDGDVLVHRATAKSTGPAAVIRYSPGSPISSPRGRR